MFSSFFSAAPPVDPTAPTFHPISSQGGELFGPLEPKDTEWACASGFITETQVFYTTGEDGTFLNFQLIHSSVGLWYPTIQCTCKVYDPKTGEMTWKSVNVTNFVTPPPGLDKRSSKADEFSVTYKSNPDSDSPESYIIRANLGTDFQLSLEISRPKGVPGFKIGQGEKGGFSYFGPDVEKPDGYVVHRFWPRYYATGHIIRDGKAQAIQGPGMFIHAIQGMRPNLVAATWNFANFQSPQQGGVSATQMEFKTLQDYGPKGAGSGGVVVNIGSLVLGDKLVAVTAETHLPGEESSTDAPVKSRATFLTTQVDPDAYHVPGQIAFEWAGASLLPNSPGKYTAKLQIDVGTQEAPKGLVEKVDVLAEIPRVIKLAVNYVAGTKPYIYQWLNPATLSLTGPDGADTEIEGTLYNEATFIS
ncbi:survival factor 1 [Roridomyces roridus]|uniref:Survival factor 1 n=1 Tax=Roridomyces roridus TaxID=1738132 RepID=A0AAD7G2B2_9AGAR|nr:survival factor 1 [Roridomyces roridus]